MTGFSELNRRFAIPGVAEVIAGNGGLPKVRVITPAATGEMYLHGAQVTSWAPAGASEVLFLSSQSSWEEGKAIRGGVPICFPWFRGKADNPKAPAHGFVRTRLWQLASVTRAGDSVTVTMFTESDEASRRWWPGEFRLVHSVTFGKELGLELTATNTGNTPFRFEEALHSYFRVAEVGSVRVAGLDGVHYLDNMDSNHEKVQRGDVIVSEATDRAYEDAPGEVEIDDSLLRRRIRLKKENSETTVVWNPWQEGAKALADLADKEWRHMLCIEASNVMGFAVALAPGEQHSLKATVSL